MITTGRFSYNMMNANFKWGNCEYQRVWEACKYQSHCYLIEYFSLIKPCKKTF